MSWLDQFAQTRMGDVDRLSRAGIHSAPDLLAHVTSYGELKAVAQASGVPEQRLLTLAVQAQFHRLRADLVALAF